MRDDPEADEIEQRAVIGVREERRCGDGKHPACRAPRRLEHEHDADGAEHDVNRRGIGCAVDEGVEIDDRPEAGGDREQRQQPVRRRHTRFTLRPRRVVEEAQNEDQQQEARAIDERLDDADHPIERVDGQGNGQRHGHPPGPSKQLPCCCFDFEIFGRSQLAREDYGFHAPCSV